MIYQPLLKTSPSPGSLRRIPTGRAGVMLVEVLVAITMLALVLMSSITGLLSANRQAAAYRALTAARLVVERNIETALAVTYDASTTPAILATTSASGVVYDDDGGGDNQVNLLVQDAAGSTTVLKGTLTRIVLAESNAQGSPIKRITFRCDFTYRGRAYSTAMTTLRAIDDF